MPDEREDPGKRRYVLPAVVLGMVVVVAAVIAGAALAQSAAAPAGETIIENANHHYRSANTLTGTADVTVSNATTNRSATVEYAAAKPDSARVAVTYNHTTATFGTNATLAWVSAPALGIERAWNTDHASSGNATEACNAVRSRAAALAANHTNQTRTAADELGGRLDDTGSNATGLAAVVATNPRVVDCDAIVTQWADTKRAVPTNLSEANLTATTTGSTTIDGTEAYVVDIEPENGSRDGNATVVVAKNDSRVLEQRVNDGENATVVRYHDQHFDVSMDESTFAPPTARSAAGTYDDFGAVQDATDSDLPRLDASRYEFETAAVTHTGGGTTVAQRYANATTNATLVSTDSRSVPYDALNGTQTTVDGRNATVATVRGEAVVAWTDGGTTYAVVTDGSTDDATVLARTVST